MRVRKRIGRPPLLVERTTLNLVIQGPEARALERLAADAGLSKSQWVRRLIVAHAKEAGLLPEKSQKPE